MKFFLIIAFQLVFIVALGQQKALFTQYMFNGLVVNPSYSAIDEALNVTAVSRHQWVGFKGAPNTQSFSIHTPIKESNSSIGLMLMRDQIGEVIKENGVFLSFAQRVQLAEGSFLAIGVNGGFSKYVANYSQVPSESIGTDPVFSDQNDLRGNFGFGVTLFSDRYYVGFSSPFFYYRDLGGDATSSKTAYSPHYMLQGGYLLDLGEDLKLKPTTLVKYVKGSPLQVDLNANLLIKETFWIGISWRSFESLDFIAEIQITPNLQLGYSYDFTTTSLAKTQKGSHEVMLNIRFPVRGREFPRCYF